MAPITFSERITLLKEEFPGQTIESYIRLAEKEYEQRHNEQATVMCFLFAALGVSGGVLIGVLLEHYRVLNLLAEHSPQLLPVFLKITG